MAEPDNIIEEDIGGVQGSEPEGEPGKTDGGAVDTGVPVAAPDAGEIEWAGGLVKKAPGSPPA